MKDTDMRGALYKLLMSQGIEAGKRAGTRKLVRKIARAAEAGAAVKEASAPVVGEEFDPKRSRTAGGGNQPMGMGKNAEAEAPASDQGHSWKRQHRLGGGAKPGVSFAVLVNPDMTKMAMRQTTHAQRAVAPRGVVSLMVIEGGKS